MDSHIKLFKKLKWVFFIIFLMVLVYPCGYFVLDSNKFDNNILSITHEHDKGIGAYIINLNRSKERYKYVKSYVEHLGIKLERIEAIDGSMLSSDEIHQKVDLKSYKVFLGHIPKRGTIGCSLSHIKAWEKFLKSSNEFGIIFEDDVSFDPYMVKAIIQELLKNSDLWDLVSLELNHKGAPLKIKNLTNNHYLAIYLMEITHAGAYIINRKAAKNLLEKALPIKMPIDHFFTRSWELGIQFTGVENPRLIAQTFGDSDTGKTLNLPNEKINILDRIKHHIYKLQSYLIRFFYNLKLYFSYL